MTAAVEEASTTVWRVGRPCASAEARSVVVPVTAAWMTGPGSVKNWETGDARCTIAWQSRKGSERVCGREGEWKGEWDVGERREEGGGTFDGMVKGTRNGNVLDDCYIKLSGRHIGPKWAICERLAGAEGSNCAAHTISSGQECFSSARSDVAVDTSDQDKKLR